MKCSVTSVINGVSRHLDVWWNVSFISHPINAFPVERSCTREIKLQCSTLINTWTSIVHRKRPLSVLVVKSCTVLQWSDCSRFWADKCRKQGLAEAVLQGHSGNPFLPQSIHQLFSGALPNETDHIIWVGTTTEAVPQFLYPVLLCTSYDSLSLVDLWTWHTTS